MVETKFGGDAGKVSPTQEDKYRRPIIPSRNDVESNVNNNSFDSASSHVIPSVPINPFLTFLPFLVGPLRNSKHAEGIPV